MGQYEVLEIIKKADEKLTAAEIVERSDSNGSSTRRSLRKLRHKALVEWQVEGRNGQSGTYIYWTEE